MNPVGHVFRILLPLMLAPTMVTAQTFTDRSDLLDVQIERGVGAWSAATVDINADGFLDIYQPGQMYLGASAGYTASVEALVSGYSADNVFGATWADVNDDGFPDAFESVLRSGSSNFYANRSGFRLENRTLPSGLHFLGLAQGAAFADFDGNGTLDVFVGDDTGGSAVYFGDETGSFTPSAQNTTLLARIEKSYGVAAADFDGDGDIDVYIGACDPQGSEKSINLFYRNRGDGTFDEVATGLGVDDNRAAWGVVWLDFDNDGWLDLFVANMRVPGPDGRDGKNRLFRNLGSGTFEDVSETAGIEGPEGAQSFGAAAADFDNDGWVDIYVANAFTGGPAQLLHNEGDGTFTDRYEASGFLVEGALPGTFVAQQHLAVSVADLNADGWIDVFTGATSAPYNRILLNDGGSNTWLGIRLNQDAPNRDAIGAIVRAHTEGHMQTRTIAAGDGFVSQNFGLGTHFGLGTAAIVDSLVVTWPDGTVERWLDLNVNANLTIRRGHGPDTRPVAAEPVSGSWIGGTLLLEWSPGTDPGDILEYQPVLSGPSGQVLEFGWTIETRLELISEGVDGGEYQWAVVTRDSATIRRSTTSKVFLASPVAVEESTEQPEVFRVLPVWPNPVQDRLTVPVRSAAAMDLVLEVVDVLGRVPIRSGRLSPGGEFHWTLDVSSLPAGLYLARISGSGLRAPKTVPFLVAR